MTKRESLAKSVQRAAGNREGQLACPACGGKATFRPMWSGRGFTVTKPLVPHIRLQ